METGGLLVVLGVGVGAWFVRRWTKSGKAPPTSLKCLNCPVLVEEKRRLWVFIWCLVAAEVVTVGAWLWSSTPR